MRLAVLEATEGDLFVHQWTWAAADRLGAEVEWVDLPSDPGPDAILYMSTFTQPAASWGPGVPTAEIRMLENGDDDRPPRSGVDVLRTSITDPESAMRTIGDWLTAKEIGRGLTGRERQMIEVIVQEVTAALEADQFRIEDREEVAQLQAAIDTTAAQLRAPRPSRRVVRWALGQIPGFAVGMLSSVSSNYLTVLLT